MGVRDRYDLDRDRYDLDTLCACRIFSDVVSVVSSLSQRQRVRVCGQSGQ